MKTYLFFIKAVAKNSIFYLTVLFIGFLTFQVYEAIHTSVSSFTSSYIFNVICFNLFIVTATTSVMLHQTNILSFLERDQLKKQISLIVSSLLLSLFVGLFPLLLMVLFRNELIQPNFLVKEMFHFLVIWLLTNLLAAVIGSSVGLLVKNKFSYILSLILYGVFVWLSQNLPDTPLKRYFNIFDDSTNMPINSISGSLLNTSYILDKVFLVLLILLMLFIVRSLVAQKSRRLNVAVSVLLIGALMVLPTWSNTSSVSGLVDTTHTEQNAFVIESYQMGLVLAHKLKNKVIMKIHILEESKEIIFALDDLFSISKVEVNSKPVSFTNANHEVQVYSSYSSGETITLTIEYEGTVDVVDNQGFQTYYSTKEASNLPGHVFAWYPNAKIQEAIDYEILVDSGAKINSNLSVDPINANRLEGTAKNVSIFTGQYQHIENNDIHYTIPTNYEVDRLEATLESWVKELPENMKLSKGDLDMLTNKTYSRVIVGIWPLDGSISPIQVEGDTVLVNYID